MDEYGIKRTIDSLNENIYDYISTEYFGKNDALREICKPELKKDGILHQKAFIEANNAYKEINNGIQYAHIPENVKHFLLHMASKKLGVFSNPYSHQVKALEAFHAGKDLFISTGTGSGKTECFLWPLISKLVAEMNSHPETWSHRGIRAVMLYPMNALVGDQMGRLRKIIGNDAKGFQEYIASIAGSPRTPQFGMYTGRTPYPGKRSKSQQKELAETLEKELFADGTEEDQKNIRGKLLSLGKYPSKVDLNAFINGLKNDIDCITDPRDAELITRHEMQKFCPDILITNYSMLEFMMLRPIEAKIWEDTKKWLDLNHENKLLFIIDEAHMYRGASGAEVALLIQRVMHKLQIPRERVQFILTSASIPSGPTAKIDVINFACDLTSADSNNHRFELIQGKKAELATTGYCFSPEVLSNTNISSLYGDEEEKLQELSAIATSLKWDSAPTSASEQDISYWLYKQLIECRPVQTILRTCRGHATSFEDLAEIAFPESDKTVREKATDVLLALLPLAKRKDGSVLFPSRLHLFFRGLQGIYACTNPNCSELEKKSELGLGKIFINPKNNRCKCGSLIYELINERSCGALFLKGYLDVSKNEESFIWNQSGIIIGEDFKEIHFYVIPKDGSYTREEGHEIGWLNTKTGLVTKIPPQQAKENYLEVAYCLQAESKKSKKQTSLWTFANCPKCGKKDFTATSFETKNNEPFYNLVKEQFYLQPPVAEYKHFINEGRKVLLFSDSRQKAAVLARDLTRAADLEAMRKAICMAADELEMNAKLNNYEPNLKLLYPAFLKTVCENNIQFFYGSDEESIREQIEQMQKIISRSEKRQRPIDFKDIASRFPNNPFQYQMHLLNLLCSHYRSLSDHALCWLEPKLQTSDIDDIEDTLEEHCIDLSIDDFVQIFSAWAQEICITQIAALSSAENDARQEISKYKSSFGIQRNEKEKFLPRRIQKLLNKTIFADESAASRESKSKVILKLLNEFLTESNLQHHEGSFFLNDERVKLRYGGHSQRWFRCPVCSGVSSFTFKGLCCRCANGKPKEMTGSDFESLAFWRKPTTNAVDKVPGYSLTRINTEEHTAQLSHKDQRQRLWSTTEDFEMRFQNVFISKQHPVDILSCTTTMEVGIDIGSLTAVGLRNVPPTRENYQQRAGRAGRRSASISTIITYADNRPHDSHYFFNPELIISAEPRTPWIDINNKKIRRRHVGVIVISKALEQMNEDISSLPTVSFLAVRKDEFIKCIRSEFEKLFKNTRFSLLVSNDDKKSLLKQILADIESLAQKANEQSNEFTDDNGTEKKLLDALIDNGIFPSYSFPRNVVGFYIFNPDDKTIQQKPERALELAINEYAPGRVVVVNKQTYKSGGLFSTLLKMDNERQSAPAEQYFKNPEYFSPIKLCQNAACEWIGNSSKDQCPFCNSKLLEQHNLLKPWGFAPTNGRSIREIDAETEYTSVSKPCYSITPKKNELKDVKNYTNLKISKRSSESLYILNKGIDSQGFMVCRLCGAAAPGNNQDLLKNKKLSRPYLSATNQPPCNHMPENVFLGGKFLTDLMLYVIELDNNLINVDADELWINRAAQTLAEALVLAAGRVLDVEFNEIKSGYRIRRSEANKTFVDIYLFDSLSSGAGYSSALESITTKLLNATKELLLNCPSGCGSACHDCLKNYWNQQVHEILDRFAAIQLIDWCQHGKMPEPISIVQQLELLAPLQELDTRWTVSREGDELFLEKNGQQYRVCVHPAMMRPQKDVLSRCICISDLYLRYALPLAEEKINAQWTSK